MAKRLKHHSGSSLPVSNRFEVLSDASEDESDASHSQTKASTGIKKPKKLPNIVLDGHLTDHKATMESLKSNLSNEVDVRCQFNKTVIKTKSKEDFNKTKEFLQAKKYAFFSHTPIDDKPLHMVLKGLPPKTSVEDISAELTQKEFKVLKMKLFGKKNSEEGGLDTPTVMSVIFDKGTDIKKVMAVNRLYYSVVSWEKYINKSQVTQCYKCLKFGHISVNCNRIQVCLNCAGNHTVKDCVNETPKCSNCKKAHPANSKECEFYQRSASRNKQSIADKSTNVFAPNKQEFKKTQPGLSYMSALAGPSHQRTQSSLSHSQANTRPTHSDEFNFIKEMKSLFQELNMVKIINAVKIISTKLKTCNGTFEKMTTVLEVLFELF